MCFSHTLSPSKSWRRSTIPPEGDPTAALLLLLSGVRGGGESGVALPLPLLAGAGLRGRPASAVTSTAVFASAIFPVSLLRAGLREGRERSGETQDKAHRGTCQSGAWWYSTRCWHGLRARLFLCAYDFWREREREKGGDTHARTPLVSRGRTTKLAVEFP